jgi:hypothetical protein
VKNEQLIVSSLEEERMYFNGYGFSVKEYTKLDVDQLMPTGTYRVVNGCLYRILSEGPKG